LKVVSKVSAFNHGLEIHGLASKLGFVDDPFIQTGLIAMYASALWMHGYCLIKCLTLLLLGI